MARMSPNYTPPNHIVIFFETSWNLAHNWRSIWPTQRTFLWSNWTKFVKVINFFLNQHFEFFQLGVVMLNNACPIALRITEIHEVSGLPTIYKQSTITGTTPLFFIHQCYQFICYTYKLFQIAYKTFYSTQNHSHHNYLTRTSQRNLQLPNSTTAAGHHSRVSYQCASLWKGMSNWTRAFCRLEVFRPALKQHLVDLL